MPFVEILPPEKGALATGVRVSVGAHGMSVTVAGRALFHLGVPDVGAKCKVFHDADPALPRLRILVDKGGKFILARPGRMGPEYWLIRLGRSVDWGRTEIKKADCTWEPAEGRAIDIDLPRELRAVATEMRNAAAPSTSGGVRQTAVSLPAVGARKRA